MSAWLEHVKELKKKHPSKTLKEVLKLASKSYKGKSMKKKGSKSMKKRGGKSMKKRGGKSMKKRGGKSMKKGRK